VVGRGVERLLIAVLLLVVGLVAGELRAESGVGIATPVGWSTEDPGNRARSRVVSWLARRADARVETVLTTGNPDDFAEIIAVIEIAGPYDESRNEALELERAIDRMMPWDPASVEIATRPGPPLIVTARWTKQPVAYRVALVPAGQSRALVVLATLADETPLYPRAFDDALAGLSGAKAPVPPFDLGRWRMLALLGWILPAALLLGVVLWRRPFQIQYAWIGRGFALLFFTASIVAAWIVHGRMAARTDELHTIGISPETLTAETVTYGIAIAIVGWIVGAVLSRRDRPVESAPTSGVFAGRSSTSNSSMQIPIVPKDRVLTRRSHPDGPSTLHPATDPPGGSLRPIDPGQEPRDVE
jgi:hypothetical protein